MKSGCALALMWLVPSIALALGPHEILVLVNKNSPRSVAVGTKYAVLRRVPDSNVVSLSMPAKLSAGISMSSGEFTQHIWLPATAAAAKRGVDDHILAWVYSLDFPVRIATDPPLSVQGLTFTRNRLPDPDAAKRGTYSSPLFAGPDGPKAKSFPAQSFDVLAAWLGEDMPLPSVSLGYAGKRGNSTETIVDCLRRGIDSDHTAPDGTVYFAADDNVRAKARAWQFEGARQELARKGIQTVVDTKPPSGAKRILGLMLGEATVLPAQYGTYVQGCIADHLTSAAAEFDASHQTKVSAWIDAGVTMSAGTVTEPYALWMKFPTARTYAHYVSGCTAIESIYQSIRCPLQTMVVGEPLARPWAVPATLRLHGLAGGPIFGDAAIRMTVASKSGRAHAHSYTCLIDGRIVKCSPTRRIDIATDALNFDTTTVPDGPHTLRVVAYTTGAVRNQVFAEKRIVIKNRIN